MIYANTVIFFLTMMYADIIDTDKLNYDGTVIFCPTTIILCWYTIDNTKLNYGGMVIFCPTTVCWYAINTKKSLFFFLRTICWYAIDTERYYFSFVEPAYDKSRSYCYWVLLAFSNYFMFDIANSNSLLLLWSL